jgi:hypothetical protein
MERTMGHDNEVLPLDEWKQGVARLAVGNPLLMLAISTALAAILIGRCIISIVHVA